MKKNKLRMKRQKKLSFMYRVITILSFIFSLSIGSIFGLLWFIRPSESMVEKRKLNQFPTFSVETFLNGDYFSDISSWYSDTYPMRDQFISMNNTMKSFNGITSDEQMIGGGSGDSIPTDGKKKIKDDIKVPDSGYLSAEIQDRIMNGLYIEKGAAYKTYYFDQESADTYVDMMNKTAKKLKGVTNVYSLLVPNSAGVLLDDKTLEKLGGANQRQAIDYYFMSYSDDVIPIEFYDTLRENRDEYLYFRTDHHWTTQATYYVYESFCKLKGFEPNKKEDFEKIEISPFLGTYYAELQLESMAKHPDKVVAYVPKSTNLMKYEDSEGNEYDAYIINDTSNRLISDGYFAFVGGDLPYVEIDNPDIEDGSTCLVIKDSYGNCFIPYLVDHYDRVFYMDFRYAPYSVERFCLDNQITDLIFENNMAMIGSVDVVAMIKSIL